MPNSGKGVAYYYTLKMFVMKKMFAIALAGLFLQNTIIAQTLPVKQVQLKNFQLQSTYMVSDDGKQISSPKYQSSINWYPVKVPCTVLSGLVQNGVYPNPYIGLNNMLIPDANDSFNVKYNLGKYSFIANTTNPWNKPYWYKTAFFVPQSDKGKLFQLVFKGINYRADVWLNGNLIADSSQLAGMFADFVLNASNAIKAGEKNILAVKIYPLDYAGMPDSAQLTGLGKFYSNGGPTGDIGKNVTELCSVGWDWIPEVHDRNMGIWQPVYLRTTGNVVIQHPQIITQLPNLPDTSVAELNINVDVKNFSNQIQTGNIKITVSPKTFAGNGFSVLQNITLQAGEQKQIQFNTSQFKQLIIQQPHLWWPAGYGNPDLYNIKIQFITNNAVSDENNFVFGIRTTTSKYSTVDGWGKREFYVNGKRIHLVGGAWVPDMLLQEDSLRFEQELQLCKNANANLIRIWGGGVTPQDDFWDVCDKLGLLVWNDFWITGDTHGEFKGSPNYPYQSSVFINNVISSIYRIRNHPALLVWTGGNEGHAREELYNAMRDNVAALDGTRPFIPSSSGFAKLSGEWKGSLPDGNPGGVYSGGSYGWEDATYYFKKINEGKDWLFKDETGIPSQSPIETLRKIIPDTTHDATLPYPFNNSWGYHDACAVYKPYFEETVKRYGTPTDLKDFSYKMQLMNADGYRAIFEAAAHKLNNNGGVMLWKLNPAFPSVIWQIFDWFLAPNAGYYFMQQACQPVHIQFNVDDSSIAIVNRTYHAQKNISADIKVYNVNSKLLFNQNKKINLAESDVQQAFQLKDFLRQTNDILFVVLNANDENGKNISHNVYWLQAEHNFDELNNLPAVKPTFKIIKKEKIKTDIKWTIKFLNSTNKISFFIHPKLVEGDEEIFPCFWSNNYFTLAPHEEITVTATYPEASIKNKNTNFVIDGWNVGK